MTRRNIAIAFSIGLIFSSLGALAQTYHDTSGTAVPAVVIVDPIDHSGPLGTTSNPIKVIGSPGSVFGEIVPSNTSGVSIKASAGTVYSLSFSNNGATPFYVKLYNSGAAPTCGSASPVARFEVPANSTPANGAGSTLSFGLPGVTFSSGIGVCVTAGIADGDTTAPASGIGLVNISYQ